MKSGDLVVLIQPQDSFVAVSGPGAIGLPASQTGKPVKKIDAIAEALVQSLQLQVDVEQIVGAGCLGGAAQMSSDDPQHGEHTAGSYARAGWLGFLREMPEDRCRRFEKTQKRLFRMVHLQMHDAVIVVHGAIGRIDAGQLFVHLQLRLAVLGLGQRLGFLLQLSQTPTADAEGFLSGLLVGLRDQQRYVAVPLWRKQG